MRFFFVPHRNLIMTDTAGTAYLFGFREESRARCRRLQVGDAHLEGNGHRSMGIGCRLKGFVDEREDGSAMGHPEDIVHFRGQDHLDKGIARVEDAQSETQLRRIGLMFNLSPDGLENILVQLTPPRSVNFEC